MPQVVAKDELLGMAGRELGPSPWLRIDQARIDLFADATGDHQYIHVDPEKAAQSPFGTTIAHGFLTLSLLPYLAQDHAPVPAGLKLAINYGLNKVRFLQPVKTGSEVRLRSRILEVAEKSPGRILLTSEATIEIKGEARPALIAETLVLYLVEG
ncbi:MAG: MaoC family dehydratase [Acidobacteria bacterium]|nr:MAG: MaoC family dehydratase [Acidobacteriota bacterium]